MRSKRFSIWMAGLLGFVVLLGATAHAQECAVGEVGPFSLAGKDEVEVCGNNLYGDREIRVGIATFDALSAREPLDLQFVNLEPREGFCLSPRLGAGRQKPWRKAVRKVIVQASAAIDAGQASPFPIVLSVQRSGNDGTVDAVDYAIWRDNLGSPPTDGV